MTRFARSAAGASAPAILTAPLWLPFFIALVLLLFVVLLFGMALATGSLWLDTVADYLLDWAAGATEDLDAWFTRVTGWRA
jgi:hypothetical protein